MADDLLGDTAFACCYSNAILKHLQANSLKRWNEEGVKVCSSVGNPLSCSTNEQRPTMEIPGLPRQETISFAAIRISRKRNHTPTKVFDDSWRPFVISLHPFWVVHDTLSHN